MAGNLQSPRKRALEIGTDAGKFHRDIPYDYQGGHPQGGPGMPSGSYDDAADSAKPTISPSVHEPHKPIR